MNENGCDFARYFLPETFKSIVRRRIYRLRRATARLRAEPSFIVIGAQKSGTSSFYSYLASTPHIVPAFKKEPNYFNYYYEKGALWYRAFFPTCVYLRMLGVTRGRVITGESSTNTMANPESCLRIFRHNRNMKIIAILREPVSRAISAYYHMVRSGKEVKGLEEAISIELTCGGRDYLSRGKYHEILTPYLEAFGKENVFVVSTEELSQRPRDVLSRTLLFLGFDTGGTESVAYTRHNTGSYGKQIPPELEASMKEYFAPHNEKLFLLIGKRLW